MTTATFRDGRSGGEQRSRQNDDCSPQSKF